MRRSTLRRADLKPCGAILDHMASDTAHVLTCAISIPQGFDVSR